MYDKFFLERIENLICYPGLDKFISYVYVIKGKRKSKDVYKIGKARKPEERMKDIQNNFLESKLVLICKFPTAEDDQAKKLEYFLHRLFYNKRVEKQGSEKQYKKHNEWFFLWKKDLDLLLKIAKITENMNNRIKGRDRVLLL